MELGVNVCALALNGVRRPRLQGLGALREWLVFA